MSMEKYTDSIGNEHYCDDRVAGLLKELTEIEILGDKMSDHITRLMIASNDCLDLRNEKYAIQDTIEKLTKHYNDFVIDCIFNKDKS